MHCMEFIRRYSQMYLTALKLLDTNYTRCTQQPEEGQPRSVQSGRCNTLSSSEQMNHLVTSSSVGSLTWNTKSCDLKMACNNVY